MDVLAETAHRGKLVLCVTHHLDNIDRADRVLILGEGKLVYDGRPQDALRHLDARHCPDIFVRLEDEGASRWQLESQKTPAGAVAEVSTLREERAVEKSKGLLDQTRTLAHRTFRSVMGDSKLLRLIGWMPVVIALVLAVCYLREDFASSVVLTRKLTSEEGRVLKSFWPMIRDAARATGDQGDAATPEVQARFFLDQTPEMKKNLADPEVDQVLTEAAEGRGKFFPDRRMADPMSTYTLLAVWMMALSFLGMLLGMALLVKKMPISMRKRETGVRPLAHLLAKLPFLALASAY